MIYPVPGTVFNPYTARGALTLSWPPTSSGPLAITARSFRRSDRLRGGRHGGPERNRAGLRAPAGWHPGAAVTVTDRNGNTVAIVGRLPDHPATPVQTNINRAFRRRRKPRWPGRHSRRPRGHPGLNRRRARIGQHAGLRGGQRGFRRCLPARLHLQGRDRDGPDRARVESVEPRACPSAITVNGEVFHNFEGETTPSLSMAQAFAMSCNTASSGCRIPPRYQLPHRGVPVRDRVCHQHGTRRLRGRFPRLPRPRTQPPRPSVRPRSWSRPSPWPTSPQPSTREPASPPTRRECPDDSTPARPSIRRSSRTFEP